MSQANYQSRGSSEKIEAILLEQLFHFKALVVADNAISIFLHIIGTFMVISLSLSLSLSFSLSLSLSLSLSPLVLDIPKRGQSIREVENSHEPLNSEST